jgi:molybdenum cofactor guanylyltransferase
MGGADKGLIELNSRPMIQYILDALQPQVAAVLVNANRNRDAYARLCGCRVVPDMRRDYAGPLAGMVSAMQAAATRYVLTVPCDCPFVPADLADRLLAGLLTERAELGVAHDGQRLQPVFALLRRDLSPSLLAYLETGQRKIDLWYARHRMARVDLSDMPDAFINVNTPEERSSLEQRLMRANAC